MTCLSAEPHAAASTPGDFELTARLLGNLLVRGVICSLPPSGRRPSQAVSPSSVNLEKQALQTVTGRGPPRCAQPGTKRHVGSPQQRTTGSVFGECSANRRSPRCGIPEASDVEEDFLHVLSVKAQILDQQAINGMVLFIQRRKVPTCCTFGHDIAAVVHFFVLTFESIGESSSSCDVFSTGEVPRSLPGSGST